MFNNSLAIIIPVFNRIDYTKKCLSNLVTIKISSESINKRLSIVVVDDGSRDGTSEWIRKFHPDVHIVYGDGNLWWSGGVNKGISYAIDVLNSDYILWWNNDIIAAPDYFSELFGIIEKSPVDIVIGSKIYRMNNDLLFGMGGRFDPVWGYYDMYGHNQTDSEELKKSFEVDWFPGMGTTFHRTVFEKIGLVDEENFPQYHGDSDFTFRAKKAGFKLIAYPELVIYNDGANRKSSKTLYHSLTDTGSLYNFSKYMKFFGRHATSFKAYRFIFNSYFRYIGGFYKWKMLNLIGIKKSGSPE
jgi:GT2 family glycosyltransferase